MKEPQTPRFKSSSGHPVITAGELAFETRLNQTVGDIDVVIGKKLGSGTQGDVFEAVIFALVDGEIQEIDCVAKRIKDTVDSDDELDESDLQQSATIPLEMSLQGKVTDFLGETSSSSANLLRSIALFQDRTGIYALSSKCELPLSARASFIQDAKTSDPLFHDYARFKVFCSILNAINTLAELELPHGDIKPDNIMFKKSTQSGVELVLLDFGSMQPEPGIIKSTPLYMAPEVGKGEPTSVASDIYALGAMLKELSGEKINLTSEQTEITAPMALILERGQCLIRARELRALQSIETDPQTELRTAISLYRSLTDGLQHLFGAMFETLPENRPDLETLKMARDKLQSILTHDLGAMAQSKYMRRLFDGTPAGRAPVATRLSDTLSSTLSLFGRTSPAKDFIKPERLAPDQLEPVDQQPHDDDEPDTTIHQKKEAVFSPPATKGPRLFSPTYLTKVPPEGASHATPLEAAGGLVL